MAIIPQFFKDSVVALGIVTTQKKMLWIGTGFLVGRREKSNFNKATVYILTNKHVVENQSLLFVRFNNENTIGVKDLPMSLLENGVLNYSKHPDPKSDIVAIRIAPDVIKKENLTLEVITLDDCSLTLQQMKDTGVDEGSLVYALGFPMNLVDESIKTPICRLGCISRIADAFLNPEKANSFLVDAQTFPGNSGGPIINRPELISIEGTPTNKSANLIGILSAYIPYRDTLVSQQTNVNMMIQQENSGLTVVHPVDRIKEVVELEWKRTEAILAAQTDNKNYNSEVSS